MYARSDARKIEARDETKERRHHPRRNNEEDKKGPESHRQTRRGIVKTKNSKK